MLKEGDILQSWGFVRGRSLLSVFDGKGIRINPAKAESNLVQVEQRLAPTLRVPLASLLAQSPDPDAMITDAAYETTVRRDMIDLLSGSIS